MAGVNHLSDRVDAPNQNASLSLYVRGEYQHAERAKLRNCTIHVSLYRGRFDHLIQSEPIPVEDTIPHGPILTRNDFRALEACSKSSLGQGQKGLRRHALGRRSMMVRRRLRNYALRKYVGNVIVLVYHSCFRHPVSCSSLPYCDSHGC